MFVYHNEHQYKKVIDRHNGSLAEQRLTIRRFEIEEIDDYLSVIRRSFQTVADDMHMTREIFPANGAFFDKNGFHKLLNKGAEMFGLYRRDASHPDLIGCIAVNRKEGGKYKIKKLSILPADRHQGHGERLMDFAEDYISETGGKTIALGMVSENEVLKKWYLNRGFEIVKISRYKKTDFNICFMEKKVENRVFARKINRKLEHCHHCGLPLITCICGKNPNLKSEAYIWLLTHENEIGRPSNTGRLIKDALSDHVEIFFWNRVSPPEGLLALLKDDGFLPVLVFPADGEEEAKREVTIETLKESIDSGVHGCHGDPQGASKQLAFVILDGTWKEARKMLRKSDYLKKLPVLPLKDLEKTRYNLRRNPDMDHICTVEVAIELLRLNGEMAVAEGLNDYFDLFLRSYQAGRCNHGLLE